MNQFSCIAPLDLLHVRGYDLLVEESAHPSNSQNSIMLARNHPIAFVVGAAGFIGSHLVDHLLKLKIQVIGIDDLSSGKNDYLYLANQNKYFHFYHLKIEDKHLNDVLKQLPRLDYAFFAARNDHSETLLNKGLANFLEIVEDHHKTHRSEHSAQSDKPKIVLISSVDLYDNHHESSLKQLAGAEILFAKFSKDNNLNARIVRLGEVFGPRMHLNQKGIFARLIKARLDDTLENEQPYSDFSARGIYIDDSITLIAKSMFLGASTNKIFDGIQPVPLKVEEIKQVLLNPPWHEESGFSFTKLPPWETPNLKRSLKELSWKPNTNVITALNETLHYFVSHPQKMEKVKEKVQPDFELSEELVQPEEMEEPLSQKVTGWTFRDEGEIEKDKDEEISDENYSSNKLWPIFKFLVIWIIILVGLIYPIFILIAGNYFIPISLVNAQKQIRIGDFKKAEQETAIGYLSAKEQDNVINSLSFLSGFWLFGPTIDSWDAVSQENVESFQGIEKTISLMDILITNIEQGSLTNQSIEQYQNNFLETERLLADSLAKISNIPKTNAPIGIVNRGALQNFYNMLVESQMATRLLPNLLADQTSRQYLIVLQDNRTLKPGGGILNGLVLVKVEKGRVADISPFAFEDLDVKLSPNLVPEDLVKTNLRINNLKLSNSNFDSDYPTFARTFESLFSQSANQKVDGVFSLDVAAASDLIKAVGGINLDDGKKIANKEELTTVIDTGNSTQNGQILKQLMTKIFGISKQTIFPVSDALGNNLRTKHLQLYANDPSLSTPFTYRNWTGSLVVNPAVENQINDLIAVEFNSFQPGGLMTKEFDDLVAVNEQGVVQHTLNVSLTDQDQKQFEGAMLIYLPIGVKITKINSDTEDLTAKTNPFVKYGLSGIVLPINLGVGEKKEITISYQLATPLNFGPGSADYHYRFVKQAGSDQDPLSVTFSYPSSLQSNNVLHPTTGIENGKKIQTNLEEDREFQLNFKK